MASASIAQAERTGRTGIVGPQTNSPEPAIEDAVDEVRRLFDAGPDSSLTVRVYGGPPSGEAFQELLDSLRMYDERYREGAAVLVRAPSPAAFARALRTLGGEEQRRTALGHVLSTFGPTLVNPLGDVLEAAAPGAVSARLSMMRDVVLAQLASQRLTPKSQRRLSADMRRLLSDGYLARIADDEEQVQRPRLRRLAREILRLLGATFQRAFAALPDAAPRLAETAAARLAGEHALRDLPVRVRHEIITAVEDYLRETTHAELATTLRRLYAEHGAPPVDLPQNGYRELAERCWEIVAGCC